MSEYKMCPCCGQWLDIQSQNHITGKEDGKEVFFHSNLCLWRYVEDEGHTVTDQVTINRHRS